MEDPPAWHLWVDLREKRHVFESGGGDLPYAYRRISVLPQNLCFSIVMLAVLEAGVSVAKFQEVGEPLFRLPVLGSRSANSYASRAT